MDSRDWWLVLNVINVAATGGATLLAYLRLRDARDRLTLGGRPALARWRRRNVRYLAAQVVINSALCGLGAALIGVALGWSGPVPTFVPLGTAAFAAIWCGWVALSAWDWYALVEIARLVELERRGIE